MYINESLTGKFLADLINLKTRVLCALLQYIITNHKPIISLAALSKHDITELQFLLFCYEMNYIFINNT